MHGCQNDYIYLNLFKNPCPQLPELDLPALARKLSDRKTGIGADGLIIVGPPSEANADAAMVMFNADGSQGKMCGNGLRCVGKMLDETLGGKDKFRVSTMSGIREVQIIQRQSPQKYLVRANMGRPSFLPANLPVIFDDVMVMNEEFEVGGKAFRISCVSMGNPHCVVEVTDLQNFPVQEYGPLFEKHEVFPEGVNVEFIERGPTGEIFQRTWERGSGETKACGTGACAVAVTLIMSAKHASPVSIQLKGGQFQVEWDGLREVYLTGEAVTESEGEIELQKYGF